MNRRDLIKSGAAGVGVVALGGLQINCKPKDVSFWTGSVIGGLEEIAVLVPVQAANIKKIVAVMRDFDSAYAAGKFADALTFFQSATSLIDQLIIDLGVNLDSQIKTAIAIAGVAIRMIALLLQRQGESQPEVVAAVAQGAQAKAVKTIRRLADEKALDTIYAAAKP